MKLAIFSLAVLILMVGLLVARFFPDNILGEYFIGVSIIYAIIYAETWRQ